MARLCLVVLLVASLLDLAAFAAVEKPLGSVIQAQEAQLDNAKLEVGTSIYRGDTVVTDAGGGLRLKLGGSQLYLLADSAATLAQNAAAIHAVVARGTVGFSSNGSQHRAGNSAGNFARGGWAARLRAGDDHERAGSRDFGVSRRIGA